MTTLQQDLAGLRDETLKLLDEKKHQMDVYDIKALVYITSYLRELLVECQTGQLKLKSERFPHISRMIIDKNMSLINADLGKRLIEVEKKYIALP